MFSEFEKKSLFNFNNNCLQVILCANSKPTLNDVTYQELTILVKRVSQICPVIYQAVENGQLIAMASGQGSPCLDLRYT